MYKKILIPLDGSHLDVKVLMHAQNIAQCDCTEIVIFAAVEYARQDLHAKHVNANSEITLQDERLAAWEQTEAYLKVIQKRLESQEFAISTAMAEGPAAESILHFAREQSVDLIVMVTHRGEEPQHTPLGCIAEKVLTMAEVPVLLVQTGQVQLARPPHASFHPN